MSGDPLRSGPKDTDAPRGDAASESGARTASGDVSEVDLDAVRFGADGLVVAIVQEHRRRDVLMVAYMDAEALRRTVTSGRTWFWSRSRQRYWCKGETSGDRQLVRRVAIDCDGDALLVEVEQLGRGACHTGDWSCFTNDLDVVQG